MAFIRVSKVSFAYPDIQQEAHEHNTNNPSSILMGSPVLNNISFEVASGAFCIITGKTGCGKSTLLRLLKPELTPFGKLEGSIHIGETCLVQDGMRAHDIDPSNSATLVGFVSQDPDIQLVADKVWHELAFGMENIGMPADSMRRRVAEIAHFFALEPIIHHETAHLSGGQKQLVNLAAALALRPSVLLLDEPTAQLDPHARRQFVSMLAYANKELGITVVMATHSPDEVSEFVTQHIELSPIAEKGNRVCWSREASTFVPYGIDEKSPVAFSDLDELPVVLDIHDVHFQYKKEAPWVLRGLDLRVRQGSIHALVGANGSGKSSVLSLLAGIKKPQRGRISRGADLDHVLLPQDPKVLFVHDTVWDELHEWKKYCSYDSGDVEHMMDSLGIADLKSAHPYDISGGQQQRVALAKVLLTGRKLLLLDEPTKGLDPASTADMVRILRAVASSGTSIIFATHDLDVVSTLADEATLLFDGQAACSEPLPQFFEHNVIYLPHQQARLFTELRHE